MESSGEITIQRRTDLFTADDIKAAAVAGLAGGAVMGVLAMIIGAMYGGGLDMWAPIKQVAAAAYGAAAVAQPGFAAGPVIIGTLIHFTVSVLWAILFAVVYRRILGLPFQLGLPFLVGGVFGLAIWGLAHVALPTFNPTMASAEKPAFILGHIAFGIVVGVTYAQLHLRSWREHGHALAD